MPHAMARQDTFVIGMGNPLRQDDRAGIEVVQRLQEHFGPSLNAEIIYDPDICLAETISAFPRLIIVDAFEVDAVDGFEVDAALPFDTQRVEASESFVPQGGVTSHGFNWGMILAMARDLYGGVPQSTVLRIAARNFGIDDHLSAEGERNARMAFEYLVEQLLDSERVP